jgi:putative Mg2+ transporter-C (MgtC) family protein
VRGALHFILVGRTDLGLDMKIVGRIALAAVLGGAIGYEREWRGSTAGDRTFALVAVGAAGFTALGVESFPASAEKVIAGVVTGVGFLGAGLIFRGEQGMLLGLTTAASMWAAAAVAVLVGAGAILIGIVASFLILFILEVQHLPVLRRIVRNRQLAAQAEASAMEREAPSGPN